MGRGKEEKERVKVNASEEKDKNWGVRDEMMEERIFDERDGRTSTRISRDLPTAGLACGLSFSVGRCGPAWWFRPAMNHNQRRGRGRGRGRRGGGREEEKDEGCG